MSNSRPVLSYELPPNLRAWRSLVSRSIIAWDSVHHMDEDDARKCPPRDSLQSYSSLDQFLEESVHALTFWFFQRRTPFLSQKRMKK